MRGKNSACPPLDFKVYISGKNFNVTREEPLNNAVKTSVALEALPVTARPTLENGMPARQSLSAATLNGLNNGTTTYFLPLLILFILQ